MSLRFHALLARLGRGELVVLTAIFVSAVLLGAFLAIASEVSEGDTGAFDKAILLALRNPGDTAQPIGPHWLERAMRDITALGGFTVVTLVTVATVGYLAISGRRRRAFLLTVAVAGGALLSDALKSFFARPRPDFVAHSVEVTSLSFPSGHAMLSAITYLTIATMLTTVEREPARRFYILAIAVLLTLLIGISRIYLGVHYPTDVLAGWSVGAAWAMACLAIARALRRRHSPDSWKRAPEQADSQEREHQRDRQGG
jgi:undecaprenyl-diphosphatase